MSKIAKRLFIYFVVVASLFAVLVFGGFYGIFRYYSFQHHEKELHMRAEVIQYRLEDYMNGCMENNELSAYVKVLDDISMADAYFFSLNGKTYTCSCPCNTTVTIEKEPTKKAKTFADEVFKTGRYTQKRMREAGGEETFYVGIPVKEEGKTTAAVIIVDKFDVDKGSFWMSIGVLLACIISALIISTFLASYLTRKFMLPIHKIADTINEMSNNNYDVKTEIHDHSEIGDLARKTDELAQKLAYASKEEERLEKMQKEYLASISHELRTPVTVLRSTIEAIYEGMVPQENMEMYQEQMLAETISLERLVNDMLELSRLENDGFVIQKENLDLLAVIEDAIRAIRMIAGQKNIRVQFEKGEEEWEISGDYGRLRQMFIIVLDNAVKYSEEGKKIWINTKKKDGNYYVSIRDEGCGISEEKQKYIFDKFYRSEKKDNESGTGLGLAIMKNIAKRHDIEIRLFSVEQKGAKFTFIIPAESYKMTQE